MAAPSVASLFEPVRTYLASVPLGRFTEGHHRDVFALSKKANLATALQVLGEQNIMSVPILDEEGEYFGCISTGDVLKGFLQEMEAQLGHGWFERISTLTKEDLESVGKSLGVKKVATLSHEGDLWLKGDEKTTILTVIREGFRVLEAKPHHRIFVVDPAKAHSVTTSGQTVVINIKPGSEKPEASGLRPTDILTQTDVVKMIAENMDKLELVKDKTLEELDVFVGSVFSVPATTSALEALRHMALDHKSCLGVTDANGKLIGNFGLYDLRFLAPQDFGLLLRPVAEVVAIVYGKGPSVAEALAGARVAGAEEGKWADVLAAVPFKALKPSSTFGELVTVMTSEKLRRVYVVDEQGAPLSIITLSDVLREVVKPEPPVTNFKRIASDFLGPVTTTDDETSAAEASERE